MSLDNIEEIKKDFIATILTESILDEGPFQMNYHLRAILFSDNVVSLMSIVDSERRDCSLITTPEGRDEGMNITKLHCFCASFGPQGINSIFLFIISF